MSLICDQPTAFVFKSCPAVLLYAALNPRISADGDPKFANTTSVEGLPTVYCQSSPACLLPCIVETFKLAHWLTETIFADAVLTKNTSVTPKLTEPLTKCRHWK